MSVAVAVAAMAAGQADAAGLGRLTVQSALGQPLRAEVEITSLSREEAQSLAVKLASPDAFKQAGLEYSPTLSQLRFAIDRRPDGRALVRISSAQPLNEPFVDLLVELNWATGKFVREYTFLLDPPELKVSRETSTQDSTAPVVMPAAEPSRAQAPAPAAQPSAAGSAASPAPAAGPASAAP
ncbi:MAG TPA: fimbrial protein FimV, partial [Burkholderiaceae bacterium]|nr:fimbrial protein FimV [Burkholderiaceae bacterium]